MTENLINRISFYLASGGLFNPELADHIAVRNLLMECREALAQRTWVELTDKEIKALAKSPDDVEIPMTGRMWVFVCDLMDKLKEKNT